MRLPITLPILIATTLPGHAEEKISYNRDIRPILSENCFACHGPDKNTREAKLRLDVRDAAIDKQAITPGDAEDSELIFLIHSDDEDEIMPPPESHKTLTEKQKQLLAKWINEGAEYESHWAYIKPERPAVPKMGEEHPIDNFIAAGLKAEGREFADTADNPTLLRRLSFDLTGLPPSATGVTDPAKAVDDLITSEHFGERMAVYWLDLARYADSVGYHGDNERDVSPYRDYVVNAFNQGKPYDRFIVEQLAGDLLPDATMESRIASTFNRVQQISKEGGIQDAEYIAKYYAERVRATSVAFLGSTMGCAECHDHKFDPFTAKDFYAMEAFFADIFEKGAFNGDGRYNEGADIKNHPGNELGPWGPVLKIPSEEQTKELARLRGEIGKLEKEFDRGTPELEKEFGTWLVEVRSAVKKGGKDAPKLPKPVAAALDQTKGKEPKGKQKEALLNHFRTQHPEYGKIHTQLTQVRKEEQQLNARIPSTLPSVSTTPRTIRILPRGDWTDKSGEVVEPAFPEFLASGEFEAAESSERLSRLDLADWIASPDNPLTARAFVNRVWALFLGTGLSRDLQDLGNQGQWPTHPELLDWLAVDFVESGWDVKHLVKQIVTSRTYRQSSNPSPALMEADPYNTLYAHQNARRLPAEFIRDNALAVAGLLNPAVGGPSARPYQPEGYYAQLNFPKREYRADTDAGQYRRGLYMHWQRSFLHPMLVAFDAPPREECTASRSQSNTPLQALNQLNDPTFIEAARVFAEDLLKNETGFDSRLEEAFERLLSRAPSEEEAALLRSLHEKQLDRYRKTPSDADALLAIGIKPVAADVDKPALASMTAVTRALLNLHETITRY
ncbi:chromosome segregation protein [Haloferula helveola]|uniref:Chromosome segregation protein n=1 Tax=Haloferula helveola TaxID=490095 RepID=A0ABN6H682_9BACT|nr:chromosome segregation protein [Haloferula helveola]